MLFILIPLMESSLGTQESGNRDTRGKKRQYGGDSRTQAGVHEGRKSKHLNLGEGGSTFKIKQEIEKERREEGIY